MLGGRYLAITNIRASYDFNIGVVMDVYTQVGWRRLLANEIVRVYRNM